MQIAVQNSSSRIKNADLAFLARAVDIQIEQHWGPAYLEEPWPVIAYASVGGMGAGTFWPLAILNDIGKAGALGFHDYIAGLVFGRVIAPKDPNDASTLSHEALELRGDPHCDVWMPMGDGRFIAREMCDPCEQDQYAIAVTIGDETRSILVSDFVLPAYFIAGAPGPYSWLNCVDEPFGLSRNGGGYRLIRDADGNVSSDWGRNVTADQARAKLASPMSRTYRRGLR